ncbi:MAG: hypothetical protein M1838_005799 [Thelocarpon superellum]|nr:MAG: hypothetical protein M1838_005799 [Thelocarpon superellum]
MLEYQTYQYFNVTFPAEYVAQVEINRPQKLNAFIEAMWYELRTLFDTLSTDPAVRAIVLTAAGSKAFTAGLDVQASSTSGPLTLSSDGDGDADGARVATVFRRHIADFQDAISSVERCEKPVICVLHGYSLGLAIDISSCADVRLCTTTTSFAVKEVDIGLAADIGTLSRLPKVVGAYSWVKDVCLSARIFGAEEALRVGFVSGVFDTKETALAEGVKIATLIAGKSPVAVQGTKELLNYSRDHTVAEGLQYTGVWNSAMLQSADVMTAMKAGLQRTTPKFSKL